MPFIIIGIVCAVAIAAFIIRAAIRRYARGKCRSLIAVAKAVLEDGFGSEIGGRNALSRLTEAAALRAKHGFAVTDLGLDEEAAFDALFTKAVCAANPAPLPPPRVLDDVGGRPAVPEEQRLVTRTMTAAPAFDPDDAPTLTDLRAPRAPAAENNDAEPIGDDEPTVPGFRVPPELLATADDDTDEDGINTDIFGGQRREDLN